MRSSVDRATDHWRGTRLPRQGPFDHAELDYGVRPLTLETCGKISGHAIGQAYVALSQSIRLSAVLGPLR